MNLPKNLNLHFNEYCKDCPISDVDISKLEIDSFEFVEETIYDVYCKHEKACEMMREHRGSNK